MRKRTALTAALAAIMLLSGCGSKVTATEPKEVGEAENSTYSSEDVNVDAESSEESSSSDPENHYNLNQLPMMQIHQAHWKQWNRS